MTFMEYSISHRFSSAGCLSVVIRIIIALCLGSIHSFQSAENEKLLKDGNDQWLLWSKIGDGCKGDENAWIKPTVIGFLVGQLLGGIFGIALCIFRYKHRHSNQNYGLFFFNLDGAPTFEMLSVYKLMIICFAVIQCQKLSHHELNRFISGRGLVKDDWIIEDDDENCDTVEKASWSRYFFRGMIFGFLIGSSVGILIGFFCWKIRVYKVNYNL
ncbi:unnamed protein product [Onchocerca flexuosa]|uniref:Uncharacterized protein n=1 Tax=Onchocerca flexuosa TaxID=387005 RepID=A0A183GYT8_9BILA|nr:unnamed protein product [Onchocerca flexuosa]